MSKYHNVASIILVDTDGNFVLQKRDDKPEIRNPGMVTVWGGAVEDSDQSVIEAAVREMAEETNLRPKAEDFEYFGEYPRDYVIDGKEAMNFVYILRGINCAALQVFEGQGFVVIDPHDLGDDPSCSVFTRLMASDYCAKEIAQS